MPCDFMLGSELGSWPSGGLNAAGERAGHWAVRELLCVFPSLFVYSSVPGLARTGLIFTGIQ